MNRYSLRLELHHDEPWPDGPVPVPINGSELLASAGAIGILDFFSFELFDLGLFEAEWGAESERPAAVQFEPAADFDPETNPVGVLWIRLWRFTWEAEAFPRAFRLTFATVHGGGRRSRGPLPPHLPAQAEPTHDIARQRVDWKCPSDGKPRLSWVFGPEAKPHFHPITTPDGRTLTADMPRDHIWHHGLMLGWTGIDCAGVGLKKYAFWAEPGGGQILAANPTGLSYGAVWSGFRHNLQWRIQEGKMVFTTALSLRYSRVEAKYDWLDLDLQIQAAEHPVNLASDYGHLTFRLNLDFQDTAIITSEGRREEADMLEARPSPWVALDGILDGRPAGVLLLNHPENPCGVPSADGSSTRRTFPTDQDDLFAWMGLNPFRLATHRLEAGDCLKFRYRLVTTNSRISPQFIHLQAGGFSSTPIAKIR